MAKSGAKGKEENTVNILGMIGQQIVYDKRPVAKISDGMRCLPYFEYKSENIRSRGFIPESYLEGVSPSAMYFISESARQGGVSIAVNTGKSGSLYRKLVKVFEDYKVAYDGSVRNANDTIFQLGYLDGYDGGELINTNTPSSGELINFINIKEAAARINAEFS
jgi:DNA-directed RNA polymerase beta' subunit